MLQNAYLLAKICADTAENEQHFAEHLPKIGAARPSSDNGVSVSEPLSPTSPTGRDAPLPPHVSNDPRKLRARMARAQISKIGKFAKFN